jgi:hypothetical protein
MTQDVNKYGIELSLLSTNYKAYVLRSVRRITSALCPEARGGAVG